MKKKTTVILVSIVVAIIILVPFVPIYKGVYADGGTKEYDAMLYKLVIWNRLQFVVDENGEEIAPQIYHDTSIFWFSDSKNSIDELWEIENNNR